MYVLLCREFGQDCDIVIRGEIMEGFLKKAPIIQYKKHGMRTEDVYLNDVPANLLCHSFIEETTD
jgi:hypothetical protein